MRELILIICLSILLGGCTTRVWYQQDMSFKDVLQDCEECKYEVLKYNNIWARPQSWQGLLIGSDKELLIQCMQLKGYSRWDATTVWIHSTGKIKVRANPSNPWYNVAGE